MVSDRDPTVRLLSHLAAVGFVIQRHHESALKVAVERCLETVTRQDAISGLFARIELVDNVEEVLGVGKSRPSELRIGAAVDAWLAERGYLRPGAFGAAGAFWRREPGPQPQPEARRTSSTRPSVTPCDARALGQLERAAHVLQMLEAGGVRITKPSETNRLLGVLASSIARLGPNVRKSDYDTATATLAALEAEKLITIDAAKRKRAIAIIGTALATPC